MAIYKVEKRKAQGYDVADPYEVQQQQVAPDYQLANLQQADLQDIDYDSYNTAGEFAGQKWDNNKYRSGVDTSYYDSAISKYTENAERNRATQLGQAADARKEALTSAYLTKLQNQKSMNDALARSGIRGGATESSNIKIQNQYGQAAAAANKDYSNSVNSINQNIDQNILDYTMDTDARREEYVQNMGQAMWNADREDYANNWQAKREDDNNKRNMDVENNRLRFNAQNEAYTAQYNAENQRNADIYNAQNAANAANAAAINNQRAAEYDARNAANAYAASEQNAANAAYTEAVNERAVNAYNAKREDAENKRTNDLNLFTARYGARSLDSNKKELKSINEKLKKLNSKKTLTDAEKKEKNTLLLKQEAVSNVIKEQKDKKK